VHDQYGTRCTTILVKTAAGTEYAERSFSPAGSEQETVRYRF
jgi:hypothetical protein